MSTRTALLSLKPSKKCTQTVLKRWISTEPEGWDTATPFNQIPGPKPLPILGNSWRFAPGIGNYGDLNLLELQKKLQKEFGNLVALKGIAGRPALVMVFSPEDVCHIFRNEGDRPFRNGVESLAYYQKAVRPDIFKNGGSLATLQGDEWHQMRSKVNAPLMQPRVVGQYTTQIESVAKDFLKLIDHLLQNSNELPEDFGNELSKWALETSSVVSLDTRFGCLNPETQNVPEVQEIINAVADMFDLLYELNVLPSMWRHWPTRKYKKFVKTMDTLSELCRKCANQAYEKLQNSQRTETPSVLENLLRIDKDVGLTMAIDLIIAGVDTTSKAAAAAMYYLARYPEKQDLLRLELLKYMPDPKQPLTRHTLDKMLYLRGCIKESQRMAPIAAGQNRVLPNNIILSGYQIPKGTELFTCNGSMCNSEEYYPKADEFLPERWIRSSGAENLAKKVHPYIFLPFGHGPRACVGRRFAFSQLEILIATVFRKYKFEWPHQDAVFNSRLLYAIASPLKFKLTKVGE